MSEYRRKSIANDSPYISLRRKSALKEQERRTPPRSAHVSFGATVCCAFKDILQARLPNVYCEVSDMSGSFLHYKLLGPKRYLYRYVKADKTGKRWEAKIYELNLRKSTLENLRNANGIHRLYRVSNEDVKLVSLGSYFDSEKAASSAWDQALKNRDNINPFEQDFKKALNRELTHMFRIYIVSESFHNQNQRERLMSVYEILLDALPMETTRSHLIHSPSRFKKFSYIGDKVIQLPFFKYTGHHFVVIAKTPSQWRPSSKDFDASDTERFAADRFIRPASRGLAQLVSSNQEQSTNSVLPHFYHGLPAELKRMMVEEQEKSNKEFMDSIAYKKLFKNNEANFMKKYLKRRREYIAAAQRIQYLYRQNKQFKTLKLLVRYHRGASTIQRVFRGHRGRIYFKKYLRVMTCASLIVQSVFRSFASRQRTKALRKKMNDAAINIQRVYRGLMKRKYVHWMRQNEKCVVQIQRVARGFVSRSRATRIKKANYKRHILIPACKNIQRIWRGFLDRKNAKKRRQDLQIHNVVIPAIIRVQCIVRGLIARRLRNQYRKAWFAAIKIQRAWKKYRYYKKWKLLLDLRLRQKMASKIGAMTRGYITRKFYHHERRKQYFRRIVQPSAVKIQRIYRGYITRKKLQVYRDKTEAVITIQQMWRRRKELSIVIERLRSFRESIRQSRAATIQRAYRCYLARCTLLYLRMNQIARHGKATLVIQSAWRSYCTRIQINEFRLFSIVEKKARAMTEWKDKREAIEFDMEDAKADLKRVVKYKTKSLRRIKELKDMRIEWERRQPVIEKELANLTAEDIDRGWNEAFETEKSIIHFSLQLSVEDILSRKQQVREYDNEIEDLKLEIDDLERDLEECMMEEMIEIESYRDFEMHRANKLFADEKERRVRLQRIRWRVKNVRNNVILHERKDIQKIENDFLAKRQPQEYGILSFQKKKFMQNKLEEAIRSAALQNAAQRKEEIDRLSIQNVKAHATFDEAIQKVRKVAQEGTFDFRVPKSDIREDRTKMCWNCGRIHCDCNVKNVSAVVVNNISKTKKKSVHKRRQYDDD